MTVLGNTLSLVADVVGRCRPLRFLFVGVLNTTFSYSLFALLVFIGLHIAAASLFAVLLGILFSFSTQGSIVFGNSSWRAFVRFVLVWLVIYAVYVGTVFAVQCSGFSAYLGGLVAVPVVALLSYFANGQYVFQPERIKK